MCKKLIYVISVVLAIGFIGLCPGHAQEVENLLENGGFEDGAVTPWYQYGGATLEVVQQLAGAAVPEEPIEGNYALHIVVPNAGANVWDFGLQHADHVFEAGKKYTLSAFLKCKEGTLTIHFKPELQVDPWTAYGNQDKTMTDEWVEYYVTTPVFADDVTPGSITFHIGFDAGDFWMDDVKWYEGDYVPTAAMVQFAKDPVPDDGTLLTNFPGGILGTGLMWTAGPSALTHDVYFGTNYDDVAAGTGGTFMGNQATTFFYVGYGYMPTDPLPDGLVPGTTYYWRVDEINDADPNSPWEGSVWSFSVPDTQAYSPYPADESQFIASDADFNWEPALGAIMYTVYFGDDYDTVHDSTTGTVVGGATTYDPGPLELEKTYYWRVETSGAYGDFPGDVLSFTTTLSGLGTIVFERWENITGTDLDTLKSNIKYPNNPDVTEVLTEFSTSPGLDNYGGRIYGWLYVPVTGDYTFWLTTDDQGELWLSTNDDASNVQLIAHESNYRDLNSWGTGEERSDPIPLVGGEKYYIMALWKEGEGGDHCQVAWQGPGVPTRTIIPGGNLSPYEPLGAYGANPVNGATGVTQTPVLEWKPGIQAASHQVYFGTNEEAIRNATTASSEYIGTRALGNESYDPGKLAWASTYYWRIDEVNNINPDSPWPGAVWSFTTADYAIVEDFEGYDAENQIWYNWLDGLGYVKPDEPPRPGNGSGAEIGDPANPSFTEETIFHGGSQSMPFKFNNNDPFKLKYSEAKLTLSKQRNWAEGGIKALSLWFYGVPGSVGSFTDNLNGTYTMTASGLDIWDMPDYEGAGDGNYHDEFHFAYKTLTGAGTIIARVDSISNTSDWAKAGVMIRETLDANSPHTFACITPNSGVSAQGRLSIGGASIDTTQAGITAPHWVKLDRDMSGTFTVSHSTNGTSWEPVTSAIPQIIQMNTLVYIGLAVTAHNDGNPAPLTCQAEFSNVTITGNVSGQWTSQDIGIESNDAAPMYVAIANNTGPPAVVYHDDLNATQIDAWTEWNIDLNDFTGINLADVNSIAIGFGNRSNPQAGGSGKMYFDDIRLYRPRYVPGKGTRLAADFNGDGVVDYRDLEVMAGDWLMQDNIVATADPTTANLVAYYSLNEGAGTIAGDSAGSHNGTVMGGAQWVAGPDGFGSALHFDGTSQGQYVELGTFNPSSGAMTVALWAKWNGPSDFWQGLIGKRDGWTADDTMWGIEIEWDTGDLRFFQYDSWPNHGLYVPPIGEWIHVAVSFDGTMAAMYINGKSIGGNQPFEYGPKTDGHVVFGACEANGGNPFNGALDEVRIYDRALSEVEIAYVVANGATTLHIPVLSAADPYDGEPEGSKAVNFKDYAILADMWLDEQVWPEW